MGGISATKALTARVGIGGALLVASACRGDDDVAGSGTGGDDQMPDDPNPGPSGPGCGERVGRRPSGFSPGDPAAASQPGTVTRVVEMRGDSPLAADASPSHSGASTAASLVAEGRPVGATTGGPHIHERWGESRKLELSYCINGMPGEDAELEESYFKTVRALNSTMAEWERVSGVNFVHIVEDDTPEEDPHVTIIHGPFEDSEIARADCAPDTKAYFGVIANQIYANGWSNAYPQQWNDPDLEPLGNYLTRAILLDSDIILGFGDAVVIATLRHELGHMMGFTHEEVNVEGSMGNGCSVPDPRPVTPLDSASVLATPGCTGLSDAEQLSHHDRLSAFFLQHTPRSRFETRTPAIGYRYSATLGGGAEILWHTEGSTEGVLWRPQAGPHGISFTAEAFPYSSPTPPPPGGWFPNENEVITPLQLTGGSTTFDLLFHGPGSGVDDLAVFNSGITTTASSWSEAAFAVPVVGRFDADDLGRDVVYMYRPGTDASTAIVGTSGVISVLTDVPQQRAFAYPLAAPYRGIDFPDDIVWFEPKQGRVTTWRLGDHGILDLAHTAKKSQGELGLAHGENIPVVGDFDGDGRADIMWHGVSNLHARYPDIEDVLWLSRSTATQLTFAVVEGKSVGYTFRPFVGDFDGDGIDDIFWHRSWGMTSDGPSVATTGQSFVWYFDDTGGHEAEAFVLDRDYSPYVGDFDADGCHDIAWFDAVDDTVLVWRCLPAMRDFDCGIETPAPPDAAPVGVHWGF